MNYWWEEDNLRLKAEVESFVSKGATVEKDEQSFQNGRVVLLVKWPHGDGVLDLVVRYPDFFPYFQPRVSIVNISLKHHQNPNTGDVCLLQTGVGDWKPEETAAELISEQLPRVLFAEANEDKNQVADIEVRQAEPISEYYEYQPETSLLIDGAWKINPELSQGQMVIGLEHGSPENLAEAIEKGIRGAVIEVKNEAGISVVKMNQKLAGYYNSHCFTIHWFRLSSSPKAFNSNDLLELFRKDYTKIVKYIDKKANAGNEGIVALNFPEESGHRDVRGEGWLFYVFKAKRKKGGTARINHYLTRAYRAGETDLTARIPELWPLRQKCIAIVGLGCVGAPSVMEFARCGVGEIRLLEDDHFDAGNSCRWPFGVPYTGYHKIRAIQSFIAMHYPYVKMDTFFPFRLGNAYNSINEIEVLNKWLDKVDLIYDASGDPNVQLFLSMMAKKHHIPYVIVESRPGGWGGLVARILPDSGSGCYYCLKHRQVDGHYGRQGGFILPPQKKEDFVQPQGCIAPTFTASSFDTSTVSLAGVRMAASILCSSSSGGYAPIEHDVAVLSLRDEKTGMAKFPGWITYRLESHPNCRYCTR